MTNKVTVCSEGSTRYDSPTTPEAFVRAFSDFANVMGESRLDEAVTLMLREHRTLQQVMTKLFVKWMEALAEKSHKGEYDLRNEASVSLAARFMDAESIPEEYRNLPCI